MSGPSLKVCIFVDGLDEYEGAHGDMAEYLFDLANEFPFTKFCISSRPLPDFLSVFQDACTLKLEDLTRDDIKNYVFAKLEQNQQMQKFISNDSDTTSWLMEEIIHRAQAMEVLRKCESMEERLVKRNKTRLRLASRCRGLIEIADQHDDETMTRNISNDMLKSSVGDDKQKFHAYEDVNIVEEFRKHIQTPATNFFPVAHELASKPREARRLARSREDPRIDSVGNLIWEAVVVDLTLPVPWWLESRRQSITANASDSHKLRRGRPLPTLLIDEMSKLLGSIRSRSCREFVETHTRARCYMRRIRYYIDVPRFEEEFIAKTITLEDVIRPYALWLHAQWGRDLSNWYHAIRTEQPSSVQDSQDPGAQGRIVYLHRTARDFLEQSRNWDEITKHTMDITFNPELALLMARVIDIKLNSRACVYTNGVKFLTQLCEFPWWNPQVMKEALELVQEADRVLTMKSFECSHWSQEDPKWARRERPDWGDDLDSAAVKSGLISLLKVRQSLTPAARYIGQSQSPLPYTFVKPRSRLPLLAFALSMDEWAVGNLVPDIIFVEELLIDGADPNEYVNGFHTVWECVIYLVHVLVSKDNSMISPISTKWVRVFELMLNHGANPYACCVKRPDEFARFIGGSKAIPHLPRPKEEHDQRGFSFGHATKRGYDDEVWDENDTYPYHHCVTAVVKDAFEPGNVPGHQDLQEIIRIQKEKKKRPRKRVERKARGGMASGIPDWTS
ncbi:hypothetical protein BTUL_0034g00730 [Botrytis tulipae]|uniref:DUF7791 domain-containing protein n=1 Tax=Botrytis tulipae TaxID=87230 RepID=A0A4Z1EX65_9HELO|nr:hypothetical protein BTUL_0034g00730 [Botrytis tulipae]